MNFLRVPITVLVAVSLLINLTGCRLSKHTPTMTDDSTSALFPKGDKLTNGYFTGVAYLKPLLARDKNNEYAMGHVLFETGARTNWHTHPKGQVLIVTEGAGFYQEKGKPAQPIKKGDVINIPENVAHWHGASATTPMSHIAITNYQGETNVVWLQPVTDGEFSEANKK